MTRFSRAFRAASYLAALLVANACGGSDSTRPAVTGACGQTPTGTLSASVNGAPFTATLSTQATAQNANANAPNVVQINGAECPSAGAPLGRQILLQGTFQLVTVAAAGNGPTARARVTITGGSFDIPVRP